MNTSKPLCTQCGQSYPIERMSLGYHQCIDCSEEPMVDCIPITYHKTGNTIQIIRDPKLAQEIRYLGNRSGWGPINGIRGRRRPQPKPTKRSVKIPIPQKVFRKTIRVVSDESVLSEALGMELERALEHLKGGLRDQRISSEDYLRWKDIVLHFSASSEPPQRP